MYSIFHTLKFSLKPHNFSVVAENLIKILDFTDYSCLSSLPTSVNFMRNALWVTLTRDILKDLHFVIY